MAFEHKDSTGTLFKNVYKAGPEDNRPDYTGMGKWKGKAVRIAAWKKKKQDGEIFLSIQFSEPQRDGALSKPPAGSQARAAAIDDNLPFS